MNYTYPAIFYKEDNGYSVQFPDIESAYTCGNSLSEAVKMAEDILSICLNDYLSADKELPAPSDHADIVPEYDLPYQIIDIESINPEDYWKNIPLKYKIINHCLDFKNSFR